MTRFLRWWMEAPMPAWKALLIMLIPTFMMAAMIYLDHVFGH